MLMLVTDSFLSFNESQLKLQLNILLLNVNSGKYLYFLTKFN